MLMVAAVADEMPDIVQICGGLQQLAKLRLQFMQGLQAFKQTKGQDGHFARMGNLDAVASSDLFHSLALLAAERSAVAADTARGQIGDDAVADSCRGVVQRALL